MNSAPRFLIGLVIGVLLSSGPLLAVQSERISSVPRQLEHDLGILEQTKSLFKKDSTGSSRRLDSLMHAAELDHRPRLKAYTTYYLGVFHKTHSELEEAKTNLDSALKQAAKLDLARLSAWCHRDLGAVATLEGNSRTAMDEYLQAISWAESVEDYRLMGACYSLIGNIFRVLGDYHSAIEFILLAESNYQKANFVEGAAWVAYTLGVTYKDLDLFADAQGYIEKSLRIYDHIITPGQDSLGQAICYDQLGSIALEQGDLDRAKNYFFAANRIYERGENNYGMIRAYKNLAKLAYQSKEYMQVIDYLKSAQKINERQVDINSEATIYEYWGRSLFALGFHQAGIDSMEQGLQFATQTRQLQIEYGLYGGLADLYYQTGDIEKAFTYFRKQSALGDSLKSKFGTGRIAELTHIYEGEQRRQQIRDLELVNQLNLLELEKQRRTQQIILLIMLASLGFLAVLIAFYVLKQKALRNKAESEKRFRTMIEKLPIPIAVNKGERIEYLNDKFIETFGFNNTDIQTVKQWWAAAYPDETYRHRVQNQWDSVIAKAQQSSTDIDMQEWTLRTIDGRDLTCEFYMMPLGDTLLIVLLDVTTRINEAQTRLALEKKLLQSQKLESIGTMVGGVAHEFNNILQSIFLYSELVNDQLPDNQLLKEDFQHIVDDANRAKHIVERILTFSRRGTIDPLAQPIHNIVEEALDFEETVMPPDIQLVREIDPNAGSILCDKTQIHQIILNLCNNAIHAIGPHSGTIRVCLKSTRGHARDASELQNLLHLSFSDTGAGMDKMTQERIFDPFFTTKQVGEGTGLGLSVIHGIVEMMGGVIQVESESGEGTAFTILLPLIDQSAPLDQEALVPQAQLSAQTILIADDEEAIRNAAETILSRRGFEVILAEDGEQAFERFQNQPNRFKLLILDGSMPKMSGLDLAREIRKIDSDIPILLSSGILDEMEQQAYQEQGVNEFLPKPWSSDQLFEIINRLIGDSD